MFLTPVIFGTTNIPASYSIKSKQYAKGEILHKPISKSAYSSLPNGMQIDLPLTETDAFIKEHLNWLPKTDDEILVNGLLRYLKANSSMSNT